MILATKNGWLISVRVVTEIDDSVVVTILDTYEDYTVHNGDPDMKLFSNVKAAESWINKES